MKKRETPFDGINVVVGDPSVVPPALFTTTTPTTPNGIQSDLMASSAESSSSFTEAWLAGHDGTQFYTRTYKAAEPRAALLFIHGFADHIARYHWQNEQYAQKGLTVFTYDQRGFGRTALDVEHKSAKSAYSKTSRHDQLTDIEFWLRLVKKEFPDLPLYLTGQSMGGGLVLSFGTRKSAPPTPEGLSLIKGVVATSPMLLQTHPAPKLLRFAGGKASGFLPDLTIPAAMKVEAFSHDPVINAATAKDPLSKQKGSLKLLHDMLSGGEEIYQEDYKNWPRALPLLIVHGTADEITSPKASEEFFGKLEADDKEIKLFPDGFHELSNEPDGVKEKFVDTCASWILKHVENLGDSSSAPAASKL